MSANALLDSFEKSVIEELFATGPPSSLSLLILGWRLEKDRLPSISCCVGNNNCKLFLFCGWLEGMMFILCDVAMVDALGAAVLCAANRSILICRLMILIDIGQWSIWQRAIKEASQKKGTIISRLKQRWIIF